MDSTHTIILERYTPEGDNLFEGERLRMLCDGSIIAIKHFRVADDGREESISTIHLPTHVCAELLIAVQNIHNTTRQR